MEESEMTTASASRRAAFFFNESGQIVATKFFLALGEKDDVQGKRTARREMRLERLDVEKELSFVVYRAACVDSASAHCGLEWWRRPELQGFRGLHVIVSVDEHGGRFGAGLPPFAQYDRVTRCRVSFRCQSRRLKGLHYPFRGARRVDLVL